MTSKFGKIFNINLKIKKCNIYFKLIKKIITKKLKINYILFFIETILKKNNFLKILKCTIQTLRLLIEQNKMNL